MQYEGYKEMSRLSRTYRTLCTRVSGNFRVAPRGSKISKKSGRNSTVLLEKNVTLSLILYVAYIRGVPNLNGQTARVYSTGKKKKNLLYEVRP